MSFVSSPQLKQEKRVSEHKSIQMKGTSTSNGKLIIYEQHNRERQKNLKMLKRMIKQGKTDREKNHDIHISY